jgi:hypothetical protein
MDVTLPWVESWTPAARWTVAGVATAGFVLAVVAMSCVGRLMRARGAGIVAFEKARTPGRATAIKTQWGRAGRTAALVSLLLDFLFVAAYVTVPLVVAGAAAEVARERGWLLWASVAAACGWAFLLAGALDVIENVLLLFVLAMPKPRYVLTLPAWACASVKFLVVGVTPFVLVTAGVAALARLP